VRAFFRSIRVRLTLLYSGVLFGVAAILVASLYFGLSLSLRDEPVSQAVIVEQVPVNDGSQTEERAYVDAKAFEHQVNQRTLRNLRRFSLGALGALFVASWRIRWITSAARCPSVTIASSASRTRSRSGGAAASQLSDAVPSATIAASGWLTSWAIEAVNALSVVTRAIWASSERALFRASSATLLSVTS